MNVSVIGIGHVGLTTAACLAHIGHDVLGIDSDREKVAAVGRGEVPFHEPGLLDLVREGIETGRLRVSGDASEAARDGDVVFICVNTPTRPSGEIDLGYVESAATTVARSLAGYTVVAEKSTVPVETGERIRQTIERHAPPSSWFDVVANPEFLREGRAVQDTLEPDRIVIGASSPRAAQRIREVYRPIIDQTGCPVIVTDIATAELIKHSSNAFLAARISFINVIADVCERTGADVEVVASAMGLDPRIGPSFLRAGIGYGGSCLPKDVRAFLHKGEQLGVALGLLAEVNRINVGRVDAFVAKVGSLVGDLDGARVAVWGLSFKPDTDDLRNSQAITVVERLVAAGATVCAYDPVAMPASKRVLPEVVFAPARYEAARGADCLAICTDWPEFAGADLDRLRREMARPLVVDGRNVFQPDAMARAGFTYASVGRPTVGPANP